MGCDATSASLTNKVRQNIGYIYIAYPILPSNDGYGQE